MALKRALKRRLAAIVSADIAGYGLMMEADEDGTHRRVGELIDSLSRQVTQLGGGIITIAGDGILAEFPSPVSALRFGLFVHRHVERRNAQRAGERQIVLRVGVHVGDVVIHRGKPGGDNVNMAVRIEQIADPHSIFVSRAVYEQVHRTLSLKFEYVGEPILKNVSRPIQVYRVVNEDAVATVPPVEPRFRLRSENRSSPRIAVLPFENLNPGRRDTHLINGITDDIITGLSRFRSLSVIGRQSSFQFESDQTTPVEFARGLDVRYLLTGSIRSARRRIRLGAELIDTADNRTIWAEQHDSMLTDILAVEDNVVQIIVARLVGQVEGAERLRLRHEETNDLEAYGHVLRGEELLWSQTRERNRLARAQFDMAIRRDHNYARAYAGLSRTHNYDWRYAWASDRAAALDIAVEVAKLAVAKDRMEARGHSELAYAYLYKQELAMSLAEYRIALDLNPNDADVMADYADALAYDDRSEEAIAWMERAMLLNPICPDWYYWHLADAYSGLGRYEDVIATVLRMTDPRQCARLLASSFANLGRVEEAELYATEVLRRQPDFRISQWARVIPQKNADRLARFTEGLRKAGLPD
jgi:TolB-like protein/class 3 adenylate cyclase